MSQQFLCLERSWPDSQTVPSGAEWHRGFVPILVSVDGAGVEIGCVELKEEESGMSRSGL